MFSFKSKTKGTNSISGTSSLKKVNLTRITSELDNASVKATSLQNQVLISAYSRKRLTPKS
jgi:hypothetical protein